MKKSHCRDWKMEAYCDEVRRLEDKFYGLELNHIARRYNETTDELAKIASRRMEVPSDVFSRDLHQPSVKIDDTPEPEEASVQPEVPSAEPEEASVQPEVPSAAEGEALRIEGEWNGATPIPNWNISSEESYPSTRPKLGDWPGAPSRSFYWAMKRSSTTAAPRASSNDAYPSPEDRSCYKKYTRGLAVITQHLEPSWGMPSDEASTGHRGGRCH
jgi:hypothetical protein